MKLSTTQMPLLNRFDKANLCLDYQLIRKRALTFDLCWFDRNHCVLIAMKYTCADHRLTGNGNTCESVSRPSWELSLDRAGLLCILFYFLSPR